MNRQALNDRNITHIVTVIIGVDPMLKEKVYHCVGIRDHPDEMIMPHFEGVIAFIEDALKVEGSNVLIHCMAGRSRSATCLAAYLMKRRGLSADDAVQFIQEKRSIVQPNDGFMYQLRAAEARLRYGVFV